MERRLLSQNAVFPLSSLCLAAVIGFLMGLMGGQLLKLPSGESLRSVARIGPVCPACKCQEAPCPAVQCNLLQLQCPTCECKCTTVLTQGSQADAVALAEATTARSPTHFCPWDSQFSSFVDAERVVDFGAGQTACYDAIIFGFDLIFERDALFGKTKWLGVPNQQDPVDAMVFQEVLWRLKPDVVIELGTNTGGGALFYASIMSLFSKTAHVITVDPKEFHQDWYGGPKRCSDDDPCLAADDHAIWKERVTFIQGLPTNASITAQVEAKLQQLNATKVVVVEDGSHIYEHVLANAMAYAKYVSPGSYMIIQDAKLTRFDKNNVCKGKLTPKERFVCYKGFHKTGPGDAITDFLASNKDFTSDRSMEFMYYSQHPKGFLRRKP